MATSNIVPQTCRNCGLIGHLYRDCLHPITSFGVICYRLTSNKGIEYLMIQRKDSLSFMEFIRGKYDIKQSDYIQVLLSGMTQIERGKLLSTSFDELWSHVWYQPNFSRQISEYTNAKAKFETLARGTLATMLKNTSSVFTEPEWGFPKGRRRIREEDMACAIREFCEETNFTAADIEIIKDISPFEEIFYGTNQVLYRHVYYPAHMLKNECDCLDINPNNVNQAREVRAVRWFTYDEVIAHIRDHNQERKNLFIQAHRKIMQKDPQ